MALTDLTQAERLELKHLDRIVYLVHLELPGKNLYFSDRNYKYVTDWIDHTNNDWWTCQSNCHYGPTGTYKGAYWNVAGPGMLITETGSWTDGYRPTQIRITASHSMSSAWDIDLKDTANATIATCSIPVGTGQTDTDTISYGANDMDDLKESDAPSWGYIEKIEFYDPGAYMHYENYLFDLSDLDTRLNRLQAGKNSKLTLRFRNEPIGDDDFLIELHDTYKFTYAEVKIYELRLVEDDEVFTDDDKVLVYRGIMGQPYDITRQDFKVDCQSVLSSKKDRLPLEVIDIDTYPNADPDSLGVYRNIIYGYVDNVPCPSVVAGAVDVLASDINAVVGTITVSGDTKITFPNTGTIQIDTEQITYTGFTNNQFTGCTRGVNGTDNVPHDKGRRAFQVLTEYWYEISQHVLTDIDAVRVDGIRITSGVTTYTDNSGKGMIKFTVKPIIEKQVALDHTDTVSDTIAVNDGADVTEDIQFTSTGSTYEVYPNSHNANSVANPTNAYDGSDLTYAGFDNSGDYLWLYFPSTDYGTISTQYAYAIIQTANWTMTSNVGTWSPSYFATGGAKVEVRASKAGGNWNDQVRMQQDSSSKLYEVWKVVHYVPDLNKTGTCSKTGAVTKGGSATGIGSLSGNSSADVVIGSVITADVTGYNIERPDLIIWDILATHLEESGQYQGDSFDSIGLDYGAEGSVYIHPDSTIGGAAGCYNCSGICHNCVNGGIIEGTPDNSSWIYGVDGDWRRFGFDNPTFDGVSVRLRVRIISKSDNAPQDVNITVYSDGATSDGTKQVASSTGSFATYVSDWWNINKTAAELASLEVRAWFLDPSFDQYISEIEVEIEYGSIYYFGFILHEVATAADKLIQRLAFQSRSKFVEWNGNYELYFLDTAPSATYTFTETDLLEEPVFGFTKEVEIKNYIQCKYKRDYRQSGPEAYDSIVTDEDATSQTDYGQRNDTVELSAVRLNATADDWGDWYITQKKDVWKTCKIVVPWVGKSLSPDETFSITWDFFNSIVWDIQSFEIDRNEERITIYGQEWPS